MAEKRKPTGAFLWGSLIGMVAGAVYVLFNAPRSGRETREQIANSVRQLAGQVEREAEDARKRVLGERIEDSIAAGKAEARRLNATRRD
jgi:gas vesicle protein